MIVEFFEYFLDSPKVPDLASNSFVLPHLLNTYITSGRTHWRTTKIVITERETIVNKSAISSLIRRSTYPSSSDIVTICVR